VGRARFIVTDLRSRRNDPKDKDGPQKSLLGTRQKEWLKTELLTAAKDHAVIFWVSSVPWPGMKGTNYYPVSSGAQGYFHHTQLPPSKEKSASSSSGMDHWAAYAAERAEMADFFKSHSLHHRLVILSGDAHMLAADDGRHGDFASGGGAPVPCFAGAPLDQEASIKGGPWSQGVYKPRKGVGCFGLVRVTDDGTRVVVTYSGRTNKDEEKVSLRLAFPRE
jgi:phosphodiesterase/alkaline phosphatase D-like protein